MIIMNKKILAVAVILVASAVLFVTKQMGFSNDAAPSSNTTKPDNKIMPALQHQADKPKTQSESLDSKVVDETTNRRGLTVGDKLAMGQRMRNEMENFVTARISIKPTEDSDSSKSYPSGAKETPNSAGNMVLKDDGDSFGIYSVNGTLIKKLPCEYGLAPEEGLIGEGAILWDWLDAHRVIGVQEAWNECDPDPLVGIDMHGAEIAVTSPTRSIIFVYDTRNTHTMNQLHIPEIPEGFSARLDGISKNGGIDISACTPLAYHQMTPETWEDKSRHDYTKQLGRFSVPTDK